MILFKLKIIILLFYFSTCNGDSITDKILEGLIKGNISLDSDTLSENSNLIKILTNGFVESIISNKNLPDISEDNSKKLTGIIVNNNNEKPDEINESLENVSDINQQSKTTKRNKVKLIDEEDLIFTKHIRMEDYCSFVKLEKKIEVRPDLEKCKNLNEMYGLSEHFNMINNFGNLFITLKEGLDSLQFPYNGSNMNTIFFLGNTGSGKSTLVQMLGSDNTKIYSKAVHIGSNEFIILDYNKIGTDTITSQTLYPELLIDKETGLILCDNPGFRDTRSPVHEIIALYSMRKVLQHSEKIKIVIVSTHSSLKTGMYRDDFINVLKHLTDFINDVDKFKNSIYLIGTKAENTFTLKNNTEVEDGEIGDIHNLFDNKDAIIVPDDNLVKGVAHFLKEVKQSLNNRSNTFNDSTNNKDNLNENSIKIIDNLLEKDKKGSYNKINIFRRPMQEGPLSDMPLLQLERNDIRENLLKSENFIKINENDFGFTLTDSALSHLKNLFKMMNDYINQFSYILNIYMTNHYEKIIFSYSNVNEALSTLKNLKMKINEFLKQLSNTKTPKEYLKIINDFSVKNNLQIECLNNFKNIYIINEYLEKLEDLHGSIKYTPLTWNIPLNMLSDFVENRYKEFNFLKNVLKSLSSYRIQKKRKIYYRSLLRDNDYGEDKLVIDETSFNNFVEIDDIDVDIFNEDEVLYDKLSTVIDVSLKHKLSIHCYGEDLVIIDYIVVLSEIQNNLLKKCSNANKIRILALHTIFIDKDLTSDWFKGKDLIIIAPIWEVIGSKKINLDGMSGGEALPKGDFGEIGKNGLNGKAGGNFIGIGMIFNNGENLLISANGGDGQDGQDGGDGLDGTSGSHGNEQNKEYVDAKGISIGVFEFKEHLYVSKGSQGQTGGDSGAGGRGGLGGIEGTIVIHNIGLDDDKISISIENGKSGSKGKDGIPGKGGVKGCDKLIKKKKINLLGIIKYESDADSEDFNCGTQSDNGSVRKSKNKQIQSEDNVDNNDSPVCVHIMNFQKEYLEKYQSLLSDGITRDFINNMKSTKY